MTLVLLLYMESFLATSTLAASAFLYIDVNSVITATIEQQKLQY